MSVQDILATVLMVGGLFFLLVGGIGLVRFPDFYSRLHPAGKADTLGATLLVLGLAIHAGFGLVALKLLIVQFFIFLANPVAAHALGRAALKNGLPVWDGKKPEGDA